MNKIVFVIVCLLFLGFGFYVGKEKASYKVEHSLNELYDSSSHKRDCVKMYKDGFEISNEIKSSSLKERFLYNDEFLTDAGYLKLEDVWIKDCILKKEKLDIFEDMMNKKIINWSYYSN